MGDTGNMKDGNVGDIDNIDNSGGKGQAVMITYRESP